MVVVVSDTLGTGDVLLFYNARALISRTIAYFDGTDCSHVAIVVKNPPWGGLPRGVYLLESGYEDFDDVESHVERYGVRLSMIDDVLRAYGSHDIHVRRLVQHPRWTDAALCAAHDLVHGKPYDMDPADWLAFINHETPHPPTDDRYVCSAMVTRVLIKLAVVAPDCNWTFVTPAEYGQRLAELPLVPGARMLYIQGGIALTIAGILMSYIYGRRVHEITQAPDNGVPPSIKNDTIIMLVVALLILWAGIVLIWKGACK